MRLAGLMVASRRGIFLRSLLAVLSFTALVFSPRVVLADERVVVATIDPQSFAGADKAFHTSVRGELGRILGRDKLIYVWPDKTQDEDFYRRDWKYWLRSEILLADTKEDLSVKFELVGLQTPLVRAVKLGVDLDAIVSNHAEALRALEGQVEVWLLPTIELRATSGRGRLLLASCILPEVISEPRESEEPRWERFSQELTRKYAEKLTITLNNVDLSVRGLEAREEPWVTCIDNQGRHLMEAAYDYVLYGELHSSNTRVALNLWIADEPGRPRRLGDIVIDSNDVMASAEILARAVVSELPKF